MHRRLTLAGVAALLVVLAACSPEQASLYHATNADRVRHGRAPLVWDEGLTAYAQAKADRLAAGAPYAHSTRAQLLAGNPRWDDIGENLGQTWTGLAELPGAWLASPPHRAVLLNPVYTHVGIGIAAGPDSTFAVVIFGGT